MQKKREGGRQEGGGDAVSDGQTPGVVTGTGRKNTGRAVFTPLDA